MELTRGQKQALIEEVKEYKTIDDLIFLYEVGNVYKTGSNMRNMMDKKIEYLYELKSQNRNNIIEELFNL